MKTEEIEHLKALLAAFSNVQVSAGEVQDNLETGGQQVVLNVVVSVVTHMDPAVYAKVAEAVKAKAGSRAEEYFSAALNELVELTKRLVVSHGAAQEVVASVASEGGAQ